MKGIVFTELLELVEEKFGVSVSDRVLDSTALPSGGAYTAVGTYDFSELQALVVGLSSVTGLPVAKLLHTYGEHLFSRFVVLYPEFFESGTNAFDLLERVEGMIHIEVRKLYPDAELPRFEYRRDGDRELEMHYRSSRPLADFAAGLIDGCIAHFGEVIEVSRRDSANPPDSKNACFVLRRA